MSFEGPRWRHLFNFLGSNDVFFNYFSRKRHFIPVAHKRGTDWQEMEIRIAITTIKIDRNFIYSVLGDRNANGNLAASSKLQSLTSSHSISETQVVPVWLYLYCVIYLEITILQKEFYQIEVKSATKHHPILVWCEKSSQHCGRAPDDKQIHLELFSPIHRHQGREKGPCMGSQASLGWARRWR